MPIFGGASGILRAPPHGQVPLTLRGQAAGELVLQFQIQAPQELPGIDYIGNLYDIGNTTDILGCLYFSSVWYTQVIEPSANFP